MCRARPRVGWWLCQFEVGQSWNLCSQNDIMHCSGEGCKRHRAACLLLWLLIRACLLSLAQASADQKAANRSWVAFSSASASPDATFMYGIDPTAPPTLPGNRSSPVNRTTSRNCSHGDAQHADGKGSCKAGPPGVVFLVSLPCGAPALCTAISWCKRESDRGNKHACTQWCILACLGLHAQPYITCPNSQDRQATVSHDTWDGMLHVLHEEDAHAWALNEDLAPYLYDM